MNTGNSHEYSCRNTYLQDFFETTADSVPHSISVDDNGKAFSYDYVEKRANKIAHILLEAGCGSNQRVCIFTSKGINAYCGVLGVLKSGACWVPLGEDFPADRLQYIIDSINPKAVIVESDTLEPVRKIRKALGKSYKILLLGESSVDGTDYDEASMPGFSDDRPVLSQRSPEDLAYIIFTSGSTGRPKGVMVYHRHIVQCLMHCFDYFRIERGLRFAHLSELTFDPSLFDLFYCWGSGGVLVPLNRRRYRIDPYGFVRDMQPNVMFSVPSIIASMSKADKIGSTELSNIKHLILTGEPVQPELVNTWRKSYPDCKVYNVYGTTETAIISHWHTFDEYLDPNRPVPVGTPLPGICVFLLDGDKPVPSGETGECVVYGSQISAGYWRNEAENMSRYVRNPFDPFLPQTFYRSGDLLRRGADGVYEYLGRVDRQVKVRGHRIELREVESAILSYPGIDEVVVMAVKESENIPEAHLVAFVVREEAITVNDLRSFLVDKLPEYMIPIKVTALSEAIPRNDNNKIDYPRLESIAMGK